MLKYRGRFRVLYESDVKTGKPAEFTFIPCLIKKGSNICRHSDSMLNVYIPSMRIIRRLLNEHPDMFTIWQEGDTEGTILFPESRIDEVAPILKIQVRGKNLSPYPKRKVNISEEKRKELSESMKKRNAIRYGK